MKKNFAFLTVLVLAAVVFVSCGGNNDNDDAEAAAEQAQAEETVNVQTYEETEIEVEEENGGNAKEPTDYNADIDEADANDSVDDTDESTTEEETETEEVEASGDDASEVDASSDADALEENETDDDANEPAGTVVSSGAAVASVLVPLSANPFERFKQTVAFLSGEIFAVDTDVTMEIQVGVMGMALADETINANVRMVQRGGTARVWIDGSPVGAVPEAEMFGLNLVSLDALFLAPLIEMTYEVAAEMEVSGGQTTITVTLGTSMLDDVLTEMLVGAMVDGIFDEIDDMGLGAMLGGSITSNIGTVRAQIATSADGVPLAKNLAANITVNIDGIPLAIGFSVLYVFNAFDGDVT